MFRQAVTAAALQAMDAMPDANGRVERARDLVLTGAVTPQDDSTFLVKGLGGNGKEYRTTQHSCTCPDQAKGFTCKHRIALWIWRTARTSVREQLLPPEPPTFLPEAPASCNVYVTLAGPDGAHHPPRSRRNPPAAPAGRPSATLPAGAGATA